MKSILLVCLCWWCVVAQAQITINKKDESCKGRKDGRIEVKVVGITNGLEYQWTKDGQTFIGGKVISGLAPGDYSVTVSTSKGCMGTKSAKIWPGKEVSVNISSQLLGWSPNPIPCGVRPSYTFKLTAVPSGGTPPYYCSWGEGGGSGGECSKTVSGQFIDETVVLIDDDGCVDSDGFSHKSITRMCPKDPNDISGPDGYSEEHWISVHDEMDYTVRFENDPTFATSSAAIVFIEVPIDDDVDPFSFRLSTMGFGDKIIQVPENVTFFNQRMDYSSDLGYMVDVTAGLDLPNSRYFWLLETIDPATGQPPTNLTSGFLPVNDTLTGSGEGFINFVCKPKPTTPTGEIIEKQASIIFDFNEPLLTNTWSNIVDAFPPSSTHDPVADTFYTNQIPFSWLVEDDPGGCGVQYAEVYLSTDEVEFEGNGLISDSTNSTLTLNWGTTYYYKILGTDFVDNTETSGFDSFYIVPQRTIEFLTPDQDNYCIGDTLFVDIALTTIPNIDLYMSIDSGMTFTLLEASIDEWPFAIALDSAFIHPDMFFKAVNESDSIEQISDPFAVHFLPVVEAVGDPTAGCDNEILFVEADGANDYLWWPDTIIGNPTGRFTNVYADMSQYAYVQGTDVFGCSALDSVFLTIHLHTRDTIQQPLCEGDSIQIGNDWVFDEGFYSATFVNLAGCDSIIVAEVFFESPCIWAGGQNVYVDKDATGDNNGTSWANAFNELRDAVYVAGRYENVQEIWVAEGVYNPHPTNRDTSFILRDSIKIYGGFLGVETNLAERTADPELVQLSGDINVQDTLWDNSYHTVIFSQICSECIIDGVTITYGHADHANNPDNIGAGVLNEGVGHFRNVIFERNYATDQGGALHSSGVGANLIIEDCIFRLNTSSLGKDVVNLSGAQVEFRGANSIH